MNFVFITLISFGLAFDILAISVSQGSVLGQVKARKIILMCLMVCAWQIVSLAIGYGLATLIHVEDRSNEVQRVWGITAAIILVILGGVKVMLVYYRKSMPESLADIDFKKMCGIASYTSIYTIFAGFAEGALMYNVVQTAIVICVLTIVIVITGVFVGYRNGELDKRVYWTGGILLIISGILVIFEQVGMIFK